MHDAGSPTRELTWLAAALLLLFAVLAGGTAYWAVVAADDLRQREDNARNVIAEQQIRRGAIVDQDGELLAFSEADERGIMVRRYPYPEAAAAVGYYSLTYGTAGIEAAYDDALSGKGRRDDWEDLLDDLLHRPMKGSDIQTTLDLDVQRAVVDALGGRRGAVIVVDVPSGRVLALVSRPGYDPNTLDDDWDLLAADDATSPLLNRVTAGVYQPGGALQTVILSAMLAAQPDLSDSGAQVLNQEFPGAREPVATDGVALGCLGDAPAGMLTLLDAYALSCPAPFVSATALGVVPENLWERFAVLGLLQAPELAGFDTAAGPRPRPLTSDLPPEEMIAALAGQGDLTVTPLQMVQIVAAIANGGNAVPLHLVDAVRAPGDDGWQPIQLPARNPALLRQDVAEALRRAMRYAAGTNSLMRSAATGHDLVWFGHVALAFGGPGKTPFSWFVGFARPDDGAEERSIAAVVVIEDEPDPEMAARVAGAAFGAADTGD